MDDVRTPVITIDCWHKGCDFHELIEGFRLEGVCTHYLSSDKLWADHNRKVHGRG